jgi:hypothetical protein
LTTKEQIFQEAFKIPWIIPFTNSTNRELSMESCVHSRVWKEKEEINY